LEKRVGLLVQRENEAMAEDCRSRLFLK